MHALSKRYAAGKPLVQQGDASDDMFVLVSGRVQVVSHGLDGTDVVLAWLGPSEVFGEVALFDGGVRSASVIAHEATHALQLPRVAFMQALMQQPSIAVKLLAVLAQRLRRLTERTDDAAFLDIPTRLAKAVVRLSNEFGVAESGGHVRIGVRMSQTELGKIVGATRESVNKCLAAWKKQGVAKHENATLTVLAPKRLAELAR